MFLKYSFKMSYKFFNKQILGLFLMGLVFSAPLLAQLPTAVEIAGEMKIGWNIGNTLEALPGETSWGNPLVNLDLISAVNDAGFNTIRIPCAWDSHADQSTLEIDSEWLDRVGEVVDYCYANDMYVIINCHWDGGWLENNVTPAMKDTVNFKQNAYWTQIADYFKDYDEHLLFASANEPNVENSTQMSVLLSYHQTFIDAVRATGGNNSSRVLVIQGASTDINKTNQLMNTLPTDQIEDRLIVEVHYYDPYGFCGLSEDADWGRMYYFWGEDYHSSTNTNRNSDWGEEDWVESQFQKMKSKYVDQGIPVIIGEWGAIKRISLTEPDLSLHLESREYYFRYISNSIIRHGMIPIYWDNGSNGNNGWALFNRNNGTIVDEDALDAILQGSIVNIVEDQPKKNSSTSIAEIITASPNPVSSSSVIQFVIKKASKVNISIVNILGQKVASFENRNFIPGVNKLTWHADSLPTGVYFIKMENGPKVLTGKILVMH